jgi:E3 ubiquitin-protein ligase DOA10
VYILHIYICVCIMCVYMYIYMIFISIGRKNDVYETIHPTLNQDNDPQEMGCRKILWKRQTLFLNKRINGFCYVLFVLDKPRSSG